MEASISGISPEGLGSQSTSSPTVLDGILALDRVCDNAKSRDGCGFNKFDREEHKDIIEKALLEGCLSSKDENKAYKLLKKYKKQLKELGIEYDNIGHIPRESEDDKGLAEINERIPEWIAEHHFKTMKDTEKLYHYDHGVYLDDGETVLKTII